VSSLPLWRKTNEESVLTLTSQSQSYFTTGGLPPVSLSWRQAPWDSRPAFFFFQLNTCCHSPYVTSCLTRGWVCRLQLLPAFTSAVILGFESRGTHDHILLSQIRGFPNLEGQVPVFIFPMNRVSQLYPRHWVPFSSPPSTRRAAVEVFALHLHTARSYEWIIELLYNFQATRIYITTSKSSCYSVFPVASGKCLLNRCLANGLFRVYSLPRESAYWTDG
jgi:hypothetical protein